MYFDSYFKGTGVGSGYHPTPPHPSSSLTPTPSNMKGQYTPERVKNSGTMMGMYESNAPSQPQQQQQQQYSYSNFSLNNNGQQPQQQSSQQPSWKNYNYSYNGPGSGSGQGSGSVPRYNNQQQQSQQPHQAQPFSYQYYHSQKFHNNSNSNHNNDGNQVNSGFLTGVNGARRQNGYEKVQVSGNFGNSGYQQQPQQKQKSRQFFRPQEPSSYKSINRPHDLSPPPFNKTANLYNSNHNSTTNNNNNSNSSSKPSLLRASNSNPNGQPFIYRQEGNSNDNSRIRLSENDPDSVSSSTYQYQQQQFGAQSGRVHPVKPKKQLSPFRRKSGSRDKDKKDKNERSMAFINKPPEPSVGTDRQPYSLQQSSVLPQASSSKVQKYNLAGQKGRGRNRSPINRNRDRDHSPSDNNDNKDRYFSRTGSSSFKFDSSRSKAAHSPNLNITKGSSSGKRPMTTTGQGKDGQQYLLNFSKGAVDEYSAEEDHTQSSYQKYSIGAANNIKMQPPTQPPTLPTLPLLPPKRRNQRVSEHLQSDRCRQIQHEADNCAEKKQKDNQTLSKPLYKSPSYDLLLKGSSTATASGFGHKKQQQSSKTISLINTARAGLHTQKQQNDDDLKKEIHELQLAQKTERPSIGKNSEKSRSSTNNVNANVNGIPDTSERLPSHQRERYLSKISETQQDNSKSKRQENGRTSSRSMHKQQPYQDRNSTEVIDKIQPQPQSAAQQQLQSQPQSSKLLETALQEIKRKDQRIESFKKIVDNKTETIRELQDTISKYTAKRTSLNGKTLSSQAEIEIDTLKKEIEKFKKQLKEQKDSLDNSRANEQLLKRQLIEVQIVKAQFKGKHESQTKEVQRLTLLNNQIQTQLKQIRQTTQQRTDKLSTIQEQHRLVIQQNSKLKTMYDQISSQKDQAVQQASSYSESIEKLTKQMKENIQQNKTKIQSIIKGYQEQIVKLKKEHRQSSKTIKDQQSIAPTSKGKKKHDSGDQYDVDKRLHQKAVQNVKCMQIDIDQKNLKIQMLEEKCKSLQTKLMLNKTENLEKQKAIKHRADQLLQEKSDSCALLLTSYHQKYKQIASLLNSNLMSRISNNKENEQTSLTDMPLEQIEQNQEEKKDITALPNSQFLETVHPLLKDQIQKIHKDLKRLVQVLKDNQQESLKQNIKINEIDKNFKKQANRISIMMIQLNAKNISLHELNKIICLDKLTQLNIKYRKLTQNQSNSPQTNK